ncbi:hypothetical protein BPY_06800 [Bifidobacterium psychraerophilum]|uniref:phage tail tube protein n=1 Tax=Bifidobacterium psychraerophilum TaxID=218140 RepID=UPI003112B1E4
MAEDNYAQTANEAKYLAIIKQYELFLIPYDETGFTEPEGLAWPVPSGLAPLGYSSEDGATLHPEPGDDTEITAHNGDIVYSESAPGYWTFQFPGIELNKRSVTAYFDTDVNPTDGSITVSKASTSKKWRAVIRAIDQDDNKILIYAPKAQISDRDDLNLKYNEQVTPNMTFKFFKDLGTMFKAWGLAKDFTASAGGEG